MYPRAINSLLNENNVSAELLKNYRVNPEFFADNIDDKLYESYIIYLQDKLATLENSITQMKFPGISQLLTTECLQNELARVPPAVRNEWQLLQSATPNLLMNEQTATGFLMQRTHKFQMLHLYSFFDVLKMVVLSAKILRTKKETTSITENEKIQISTLLLNINAIAQSLPDVIRAKGAECASKDIEDLLSFHNSIQNIQIFISNLSVKEAAPIIISTANVGAISPIVHQAPAPSHSKQQAELSHATLSKAILEGSHENLRTFLAKVNKARLSLVELIAPSTNNDDLLVSALLAKKHAQAAVLMSTLKATNELPHYLDKLKNLLANLINASDIKENSPFAQVYAIFQEFYSAFCTSNSIFSLSKPQGLDEIALAFKESNDWYQAAFNNEALEEEEAALGLSSLSSSR